MGTETVVDFRQMTLDDYEAVMEIWRVAEGLCFSEADDFDGFSKFLQRNPKLSHVALVDGQIVGGVLCGHDGRRGYLHHLAVLPEYRLHSIGTALAERCLAELAREGITKSHIMVMKDNVTALRFWQAIGWTPRTEIMTMSSKTSIYQWSRQEI